MTNAVSYGQLESMSGNVLFMKSNSTAHLTMRYVIQSPSNDTISTERGISDSNLQKSSLLTFNGLTINAMPSSIVLNENNTVTYTIIAQNNIKGIYAIPLSSSCGRSLLVIGLNESNIPPSKFARFFTAVYQCPVMSYGAPDVKIIGYDGIISKVVTISQDQLDPLEQFQTGVIKEKNVQCKQGFMLIMKFIDSSPACVKPDTSKILIERGWAKSS